MARPHKSRKVSNPPPMKGFKPYGLPLCETERITMSFEEFESIRLIDYDLLPQEQAAELMEVSRPTITRIYNQARKVIARAFVEGKAIEIDGGNYEFDKDWFRCNKCYKLIQGLENHIKCRKCKSFGQNELVPLNKTAGEQDSQNTKEELTASVVS
jgi:predicted DNA-binding protein (UPF0251 family)/phage FluMu protein Com